MEMGELQPGGKGRALASASALDILRLRKLDRKMYLTRDEAEEFVRAFEKADAENPTESSRDMAKRLGLKEHTVTGFRMIAKQNARLAAGGGVAPWKKDGALGGVDASPFPGEKGVAVVPASVPADTRKPRAALGRGTSAGGVGGPGGKRPKPGTKSAASWEAFDKLEKEMGKVPTSKELAAAARAIGNVTSDRSSAAGWLKWRAAQ